MAHINVNTDDLPQIADYGFSAKDYTTYPVAIRTKAIHDKLLSYLTHRLSLDSQRDVNRLRFGDIDRTISTWQRLTDEDADRRKKEKTTGQSEATRMNLPLVHTQIEDLCAFFMGVYSPGGDSYMSVPNGVEQADVAKTLVSRLNADGKAGKLYKNMTATFRAVLKYNIAGFHLRWVRDQAKGNGRNLTQALDMYNTWWDPSVRDPSKVSVEAEWAAMVRMVSAHNLIKQQRNSVYVGIPRVMKEAGDNITYANKGLSKSTHYMSPPRVAGVAARDDMVSSTPIADWAGYGVGLSQDSQEELPGHEVVTMYCWLNPAQIGLYNANLQRMEKDWQLWRFEIIDNKHIVVAERVKYAEEADVPVHIPLYISYLNHDELGDAQRSVAELLQPFQNFGSFLLNIHVAGARGNVYGLEVYDPSMLDYGEVDSGAVSTRLASKIPGRDVNTGIAKITSKVDNSGSMSALQGVTQLMDRMYPAQAMPSQIAGMDRAVKDQVAAVLQGVSRRMHMLILLLDSDLFGPLYYAQYLNLIHHGSEGLEISGFTDEDARLVLGGGIKQLDRDQLEKAIRDILFASFQNPDGEVSSGELFKYWMELQRPDVDSDKFLKADAQEVEAGAGAGAGAVSPDGTPTPIA